MCLCMYLPVASPLPDRFKAPDFLASFRSLSETRLLSSDFSRLWNTGLRFLKVGRCV